MILATLQLCLLILHRILHLFTPYQPYSEVPFRSLSLITSSECLYLVVRLVLPIGQKKNDVLL